MPTTTEQCKVCKTEYVKKKANQKYCSLQCRRRANREKSWKGDKPLCTWTKGLNNVNATPKHCINCGTEFVPNSNNQQYCKICASDRYKFYARNQRFKSAYGITVDDYNKMFKDQEGCCAICNRHQSELSITLAVDHDHVTGDVRGLLCRDCNQILGLAQDSPQTLANAMLYLGDR